MPRPEDSGGPAPPRHSGGARVAFGSVQTLGVRKALSKLYQPFRVRGHPCGLQDSLSTLRPSCSPRVPPRLRHGRKTRYGWVARPYPTGTCTLQETPSFSWRENAGHQAREIAAARHERRLFPVACMPSLGQECGIARPALILTGGAALQPGDLLARIPKGTEDSVLLAARQLQWLAGNLPGREVGDHILPDRLPSHGHLEDATEGTLGNEGVPVG